MVRILIWKLCWIQKVSKIKLSLPVFYIPWCLFVVYLHLLLVRMISLFVTLSHNHVYLLFISGQVLSFQFSPGPFFSVPVFMFQFNLLHLSKFPSILVRSLCLFCRGCICSHYPDKYFFLTFPFLVFCVFPESWCIYYLERICYPRWQKVCS